MLKRPPRDRVITTAMAVFAGGLISLAAVVVLFMTGHRNLPAWLSASWLLMPLGFAIGAVHTVRQWRRDQPAAEETANPATTNPATADPETAQDVQD